MKRLNYVVTTTQKAYLDLISDINFSTIDGKYVAEDLIENKHLWNYVRPDNCERSEAVTIMEITQGFFYYDSIYLYSEVVHDPKKYEGFAERWRAKSMSIIPAQETGGIVVKFQF